MSFSRTLTLNLTMKTLLRFWTITTSFVPAHSMIWYDDDQPQERYAVSTHTNRTYHTFHMIYRVSLTTVVSS